jgi:hypothetical protein
MTVHKLTLSVDADVVAAAKRYADEHGTSVSALVENLLDAIVRIDQRKGSPTPISDRLLGAAEGSTLEDYHRHLEEKYR